VVVVVVVVCVSRSSLFLDAGIVQWRRRRRRRRLFLMFTIGKALECGSLNRSVSELTLRSLLIWKKVMVFFSFIESQTHNIALSQARNTHMSCVCVCVCVCVYKQVTYL
jgi:hypothetical protein